MVLRQLISTEKLLKPFIIVKNTALKGWKEVAKRFDLHEDLYYNPRHKKLPKPVSVILIGAGHRGMTYADYALKSSAEMTVIAVADPNPYRLQKIANTHKIPPAFCFNSWEDVLKKEKFADAVIIATPDHLHSAPCLQALDRGYDVLLEKPIATTEQECRLI